MNIDLRAERLNRGQTLKQVADELDISESALSMIERGGRKPTPAIAFRIAELYGHQVTDIWPSEPKAAA